MRAALVFLRDAREQRLELSGSTVTIGRGPECEVQLGDERVSIRHCRLWSWDGEWMIRDLRSTNRTYVNGELLDEQPRRLVHGDVVRLGARDSVLFEATLVVEARVIERREPMQELTEALRTRISELETRLAARDADLVRVGALYKQLHSQSSQQEVAAVGARQLVAMMASEIEAVRGELTIERAEHAGSRDQLERERRRCAQLTAELEAQATKARRAAEDEARMRKDLESRLKLAASELAVTREALAIAAEDTRRLKQAHDELRARSTPAALKIPAATDR